jgi:hypothetical protein
MGKSPFKFIGNLNITEILESLNSSGLSWDSYTFRQQKFICFQETKTIPVIFDEKFSTDKITLTENFTHFEKPLEILTNQITELLGEGHIQSCIMVNLPANKKIAKHIDTFKFAKIFKRLHIPIQTNENCNFFIGKEMKNLKVGEIWEIANDEYVHWVENNGDIDRIHIIVDWKEKSPTE